MGIVQAAAERHIDASPATVYGILADYRRHQQILPPQFSDFRVEEGGVGAGTVVSFTLTTSGRVRNYRMRVDEPEPGRVLRESDRNSSLATTFTVIPEGTGSHVRIHTQWQGAGGVGGFFERTFAPRVLKGLYAEELDNLARMAGGTGQG